jgi:hypothetical protein
VAWVVPMSLLLIVFSEIPCGFSTKTFGGAALLARPTRRVAKGHIYLRLNMSPEALVWNKCE